jgi:hypothetical protein
MASVPSSLQLGNAWAPRQTSAFLYSAEARCAAANIQLSARSVKEAESGLALAHISPVVRQSAPLGVNKARSSSYFLAKAYAWPSSAVSRRVPMRPLGSTSNWAKKSGYVQRRLSLWLRRRPHLARVGLQCGSTAVTIPPRADTAVMSRERHSAKPTAGHRARRL